MGYVLQQGCTIMCPHGGQAQVVATGQRLKVDGAPALLPTDTFTITGCPFTVGPKYQPCVTISWMAESVRLKTGGSGVLLDSSVGLCKSAEQAVQGTAQVSGVQRKVQAL